MSELILTPASDRWAEFMFKLNRALSVDVEDSRSSCCEHNHQHAKEIMEEMGGIDIPKSIAFFQDNGGYCDCEICFNVDPEVSVH